MRFANVYFHSGELSGGGFHHPDGDGWRPMLLLDDGPDVVLMSPASLKTARIPATTVNQWRLRELPFDPVLMRSNILAKVSRYAEGRTPEDGESIAKVCSLLVPPPRVRTRTNAPA